MSKAPTDGQAFEEWLTAEDALAFLRSEENAREIVLYASLPNTFINTAVLPEEVAQAASREELSLWNFNAYTGWGVTVSFHPPKTEVSAPLDDEGVYSSGEPLIFARSFSGRTVSKHYHEPLQKFIQIAGIHLVEERSAYCKFDRHGDFDDVLAIHKLDEVDGLQGSGTVITCSRETLDRYLALTRASAIRMFDFTRLRLTHFAGWGGNQPIELDREGLAYRQFLEPKHAGYVRGYQVVRPSKPPEMLLQDFQPGGLKEETYASFIAHDWRHNRVTEISCKPGATANYYNAHALPDLAFELSPAFFRPEVLAKYKADSEKYRLDGRTITCREAWHLQSYDINEAGQVHTYLVYLRNLPIEEQTYWRSFNEPPKGGISKRAFLTDFEGSWELSYDPLESIKTWAREIDHQRSRWWRLIDDHIIDQTRYPVTSSPDEWGNEILHLDQLLVEGIKTDWLRTEASRFSIPFDDKTGSIKLLSECLIAYGVPETNALTATEPFKSLHFLRTKLKGHAASAKTLAKIRREILQKHNSYSNHFRWLCKQCDAALKLTTETFRANRGR